MDKIYDVLIIGGGPAGLSSALTLARGGREVLVFDNQNPRNAPAKHMQNFPSHDGLPPSEFKNQVLADLRKYPNITFENSETKEVVQLEGLFQVKSNRQIFMGRKIILAHGMRDEMLPIPGFKELWGKAIFQCPYCHGHEIKNSPIALIGGGIIPKHMLPLLKGLTEDLILFTNGEEIEDKEVIEKNGIKIINAKILGLKFENENLLGLNLSDGSYVERSYIFIRVPQSLSTDIGKKLGCEILENGFISANEMGMTNIKGIYAAGDIVSMRQSVLNACASGQNVGGALNHELLVEDFNKV